MHLVLVARRGELMSELAQELHTKHGTRCEIIVADLSDPAEPKRILDEIAGKGISIELLVNNAGFGVVGEVENAKVDRLLQLIRLNISALTELTYRLLPAMLERGHGAILNVSSLSGFQPVAYMGTYAASKAFVLHFSEALHCELKDRGITVTAVCPGVTRTNFFDIAGAPGWLQKHSSLSVEPVVKSALNAIARRRQFVVPGWRNFLLTLLVRIASRRRVVKESTRFFRPRRNAPK
jgi:short-subunit dehydrogenase